VVRLMRPHRVINSEEIEVQVVPRMVEARAQGLEAKVSADGKDMQAGSVCDDMNSNPVEGERRDL